MDKIGELNELFRQLRDISRKVYDILSTDNFSYRMIADDLAQTRIIRQGILVEIESLKARTVLLREENEKTVEFARNKADSIVQSAETKRAEMIAKLDQIEAFCDDVDKKRLVESRRKIREVLIK